jgi:tetratricopeptide (TPR) repeat protein
MAPWVIAGAAIVTVLLVLFLPRDTERVPAPAPQRGAPITGPQGQGGGTGPMGGLSGDMRTNADRLFNRVMRAAEQGNQAEVDQFVPMAIQAYGMVDGIDADGLYHLALLHLAAGDPEAARATAEQILARSPDHILALGVAASAEQEAGDLAAARELWNRLLEAYPDESTRSLREYQDHEVMLSEYRRLAEEATSG